MGNLGGLGVEEDLEAGPKVGPWTGGLELRASQETGREPGIPWFWCVLESVTEKEDLGMKPEV